MRKPDFETMFHPKAVAFVGASAAGAKAGGGAGFMSCYQSMGFKGKIYPVNPKASEILGLKAYPNVVSIPDQVDYVVVSVPSRLVPNVLNDCADAGAKNIHIYTAGFKESDDVDGAELEQKIKEIAEARDLAIIGPNGMGLYVPESGMCSWKKAPTESGPVGMISQSGSLARLLCSCAAGAGFRFSKAISFGNGTVLDSTDYLEYFKDDPQTRIITMYLEGIGDGRKLTGMVREINPHKPVIVLKGGLTESGARAIASHTGSLAGSEAVWQAFFRQTGAVRAETLEEFADVTVAFSYLLPSRARRVAVLGTGGGFSVACADSFAREGLETPTLAEETQRQLREFAPAAGNSVRNPLDLGLVHRDPALLDKTLHLIGADPNIDAIVADFSFNLVAGAQSDSLSLERVKLDPRQLSEFAHDNPYHKPLAVILGSAGYDPEVDKERLRLQNLLFGAKIAVIPSISRAARALRKFAEYYEYLQQTD